MSTQPEPCRLCGGSKVVADFASTNNSPVTGMCPYCAPGPPPRIITFISQARGED